MAAKTITCLPCTLGGCHPFAHVILSSVSVLAQSDVKPDTELTQDCSCSVLDDSCQGDSFSDNGSNCEEEYPRNNQFNPLTEASAEANSLVSPDIAEPGPLKISDPLPPATFLPCVGTTCCAHGSSC